jgi:RNA polymerase sigma-70 factor (ECF subfamily)
MSDRPLGTSTLHSWLDRMRAGDPTAADSLLRRVAGRLQVLARQMLRRFPNVHRWLDTDDVLQNALVRLLRSLEQLRPESAQAFYGLAAVHVRRELLDLARHYGRREAAGLLPQHAEPLPYLTDPDVETDLGDALADLEKWTRFHQAVERLAEPEREVAALIVYHGWQRAQVAEFLQISERTVIRRWKSALWKVSESLADSGGSDA